MPDRPRDLGDHPDGGLSALLYDYHRRANAARAHCYAEGIEVDDRAALAGYDRALHPWMHGRRPHDLVERLRGWWPW